MLIIKGYIKWWRNFTIPRKGQLKWHCAWPWDQTSITDTVKKINSVPPQGAWCSLKGPSQPKLFYHYLNIFYFIYIISNSFFRLSIIILVLILIHKFYLSLILIPIPLGQGVEEMSKGLCGTLLPAGIKQHWTVKMALIKSLQFKRK